MNFLAYLFDSARVERRDALRAALAEAGKSASPGGAASVVVAAFGGQSVQAIADVRSDAVRLYGSHAATAMKDGTVSEADDEGLQQLLAALQLPARDVQDWERQLARPRSFGRLRRGHMPTAEPSPILLHSGEQLHVVVPAILVEERVVGRSFQGSGGGISVRVAKGVSLRTGGGKGRSVAERDYVRVAAGNLCVTSRRLVFGGDAKSFALEWRKIVNIELDQKALIASPATGNSRMVRFNNLVDQEILQAVIDGATAKAV